MLVSASFPPVYSEKVTKISNILLTIKFIVIFGTE